MGADNSNFFRRASTTELSDINTATHDDELSETRQAALYFAMLKSR